MLASAMNDLVSNEGAAPKRTLSERLGLHRPELKAWALYDLANSPFMTTIVTAIFPIYFSAIATADGSMTKADATAKLSIATAIGLAIGALVAPVLGAIADHAPVKKKFLGFFIVFGAAATSAMFVLESGAWMTAAVLFALGNIAATCGFVFYDSLLPHIATRAEIDRVSTAGYALGYLGGGILLLVQVVAMANPQWFGVAEGDDVLVRLSFVSVAVWWLVFSIPLFRHVPEPRILPKEKAPGGLALIGYSISGLRETLRELKRYRQAMLFMIAFLVYNDGIGTIARMAAIYGEEVGISRDLLIVAIVGTQFLGVPFSFMFGGIAGKIGAKKAIYIGLLIYACISVLGYFMEANWHFLVLAFLVSLVQGGTQALSRSLFASLIPKHKSAEFFGLFAVFERFAGVLGPLVFAIVALSMGSSRTAILAIIAFFVFGALLLARVNIEEGRRVATEADADAEAQA